MNTFDFGSTARPVAKRFFSLGFLSAKKSQFLSPIPKVAPDFNPWRSMLMSVLIWVIGGTAVLMTTTYVAFKFVLPSLFPLTEAQTFLLVPSDPAQPQMYVAVFNPGEPSTTLVALDKNASPILSGSLSLAAVNQRMGKMLDQVIILKPDQQLGDPRALEKVLQTLISQKTFGLPRLQKIRLWLFAQSLPSTKVYSKDIKTKIAWQQFVTNSAQQMPLRECTIALVNTTEVIGLGKNISQLLEQSGYQVVRVDSLMQEQPQSQLNVVEDKAKCLEYAERISKSLIVNPKVLKDSTQPSIYRSDMVLFLGQDMARLGG